MRRTALANSYLALVDLPSATHPRNIVCSKRDPMSGNTLSKSPVISSVSDTSVVPGLGARLFVDGVGRCIKVEDLGQRAMEVFAQENLRNKIMRG